MTKSKSIPRWAFVVAGIFFILVGGIETVRQLFYVVEVAREWIFGISGHGLLSLSYDLLHLAEALTYFCLGIILVGFRRNNVAVPIALGVVLVSEILCSVLSILFDYVEGIDIVNLSLAVSLSAILSLAIILMFSIFNLARFEKLCKTWFIPVILHIFHVVILFTNRIYYFCKYAYNFYSWSFTGETRTIVDILIDYLKDSLWYYISDILYFIAFAFLCYGFCRVAKKVKAGESSESSVAKEIADAYEIAEPIVPSEEIKPPYAVQDDAFSPYSASPSRNTAPQPTPSAPQPVIQPQPQPTPAPAPAHQPVVQPQPQPTPAPAPQPATTLPNSDTFDQLRKYKQLFDEGVITQEEFEAKKKQLMDL